MIVQDRLQNHVSAIIAKKTYPYDLTSGNFLFQRRGLDLNSMNQAERFSRYELQLLQFEHLPDHSDEIYPQLPQL